MRTEVRELDSDPLNFFFHSMFLLLPRDGARLFASLLQLLLPKHSMLSLNVRVNQTTQEDYLTRKDTRVIIGVHSQERRRRALRS